MHKITLSVFFESIHLVDHFQSAFNSFINHYLYTLEGINV